MFTKSPLGSYFLYGLFNHLCLTPKIKFVSGFNFILQINCEDCLLSSRIALIKDVALRLEGLDLLPA